MSSFPAHWHICASYIPTKENRGIHQSLTILRFESIKKIGASWKRVSILLPTGFYDESKDISSHRSLVFARNIFIEALNDCWHAKTTVASTKRPTQKSSPSLHSLGQFYLAYATYGSLRHKKKAGTKTIPAKSFPFSLKLILISVTCIGLCPIFLQKDRLHIILYSSFWQLLEFCA